MNIYKKHPHAIETRQALLDLQPNSNNVEGEVGTLTTWKYDENAIREALVSMIIIDELTFKFVEDVSTRWNSTYLMLNIAQKYERAFERKMAEMLSHFYELTLRISGSWSSLTPRIVEALICAQDWTRSSNCPINVEEDLEELEKFEEVLPSVGLTQLGGSSYSTPTLNS
ncbi:hypothetical protein GH714_000149 [Hevea brasiliensis]|uniref:hAT-like transposase RNase-H fold domain-containing protein n=1 Tax=Hevea brasiliensis TaxID=3981 RepID=A0A6A6KBF3_HEVBR|nr:hypothetical protein GH714_000149 [Hevea brasiliensis]